MSEFKPIVRADFDKDQKDIVEFIQSQWRDHPVVKNWHGKWREYIAWFEGDQYKFYNNVSNALQDVTPYVQREVFTVCNRIFPMVRQFWGEMRYPHNFYVEKNTLESEDERAAALGSMLIEFLLEKGKFSYKVNRAKLWSLITGQCYWKEWWNKDLWGYVQKKDGTLVKEKGEVDYDFVTPFNVRPDPDADGRDNWRWFIEGKRVTVRSVEEEFDLEKGTLEADLKESYDSGLFERDNQEKSKEPTVIRMEYHEKGSKSKPNGRFVVQASNYLLYDGENDSPDHLIPYFKIPGLIPIFGDQYDLSLVSLGQPSQRQINRAASIIDEHNQNFRPKAMIPQGSLFGEDLKAWTRGGVDYVMYNPMGAGTPFWQQPPPLPQTTLDILSFHERELETEMSIREVSMGRLPKYSSRASGELWKGLKGQDEKVMNPVIEDQNAALTEAVSFMLQIAIKHYGVERMIKTVGKNKRSSVSNLKGADLRNNTDVYVKAGVDLFTNKELKQDIVQTFVEKGLIKDPRQALELLDSKSLEDYTEDEFIDERQAYRENDVMKEGKVYPKPDEKDNHEVHFKIHDNDRKREDFGSWSKKSQEFLSQHTNEHMEFMRAAAAPATQTAAPVEPQPNQAPVEMAAPAIPTAMAGAAPTPEAAGTTLTPEEEQVFLQLLAAEQATQGGAA